MQVVQHRRLLRKLYRSVLLIWLWPLGKSTDSTLTASIQVFVLMVAWQRSTSGLKLCHLRVLFFMDLSHPPSLFPVLLPLPLPLFFSSFTLRHPVDFLLWGCSTLIRHFLNLQQPFFLCHMTHTDSYNYHSLPFVFSCFNDNYDSGWCSMPTTTLAWFHSFTHLFNYPLPSPSLPSATGNPSSWLPARAATIFDISYQHFL